MSKATPPPLPVQVLNYQTPTSQRRLRKPLRTRLIPRLLEGSASFEEVPDDTGRAIGAICFTVLPLASLLFSVLENRRLANPVTDFICLLLIAVLLILIGAVIVQMSQRTLVEAAGGMLAVRRSSMFGPRTQSWPAQQIEQVSALQIGMPFEALAALEIRPRNEQTVLLFRNYGQLEVAWFASCLNQALQRPA